MLIHTALLREVAQEESDLLDVISEACRRIEAVEPSVHALLPEPGRRARLLADGAALLEHFPQQGGRPLLFGALVGVKDIFVVENFPTGAGSHLPPRLFCGREASCVTALRRAGALILGKTVTTEFAFFEPGPTCNPHGLGRTPGGSSSGSAAAVASGLCPLALGTQTIGSIIRPGAYCGVVGFKPSQGRIPTDGVVPFSPSADHVGLFTQDVAGMALAARLLCLGWRVAAPVKDHPTLAVAEGPYLDQCSPEGLQAFWDQVGRLREAGYRVLTLPALGEIVAINRRHRQIIAAEFATVHASWFDRYGPLYRSRTADLIREGRGVAEEHLREALACREPTRGALQGLMARENADLWISPAAQGPAPEGLESTGDPIMNLPWTYMGLPTLTVPAGLSGQGLPLGLQVTGAFGEDESLMAWALGLERALR